MSPRIAELGGKNVLMVLPDNSNLTTRGNENKERDMIQIHQPNKWPRMCLSDWVAQLV